MCGAEIQERDSPYFCSIDCMTLNHSLRMKAHFREKGEWAYVFLKGKWIYQPITLALENKAKGCKIFTHEDYLAWKDKRARA